MPPKRPAPVKIVEATKKTIGKRVKQDGWTNVLTGIGRLEHDKLKHARSEWRELQEVEVEEFYAANDIAAKIIDELPEEALRKGYDLNFNGVEKYSKDIETYCAEMGVN